MGTISRAMDKIVPQDKLNSEHKSPTTGGLDAPSSQVSRQKIPIDPGVLPQTKGGHIDYWDERLRKIASHPSLITEEIRRVRNKILHPPDNKRIRSVLVTSAVPGEGKSFICANLGISTALGVEKNALLVDSDLRRPSLAAMFGMTNDTGLVNYLYSGTSLSQLIKKTGQAKLSLLPSGPSPANPSEILDTSIMTSLIEELSKRYDDRILFLDSPPMQLAAETTLLAKHVDAVVVVVRWGYSNQEQLRELTTAIGKNKILGIIFNAFEANIVESRLQKIKGQEKYYT